MLVEKEKNGTLAGTTCGGLRGLGVPQVEPANLRPIPGNLRIETGAQGPCAGVPRPDGELPRHPLQGPLRLKRLPQDDPPGPIGAGRRRRRGGGDAEVAGERASAAISARLAR
jgi:hypothetical protein